ncbi:MAG: hypothetical protein PVH87_21050 [Desulfobacteraceae bacterium]|jgi:hypothetical protein
MNNKLRHAGLLFFDLLCIVILWIGYDNFKQILMEINNQVEIIRFNSRDGSFIVGIGFPIMHLFVIADQLWPDFIKKLEKHKRLASNCFVGFVVALLLGGFAGSSWLQSRVENAGYVYCRYVSSPSALAKTLVYTKDQKLCEELEAEARAERKR